MKKAYFIDGYHGGKEGHMPLGCFKSIVEFLEKNPDWHINLDIEATSWKLLKFRDPQTFYKLKRIIEMENSPIELVGETISQPYCSCISEEAIIRNFVYGREELKKCFNVKLKTYASQEPCQTSALPQILKSLGYERASLLSSTIFAGLTVKGYDSDVVTWVGSDGTMIDAVPKYSLDCPCKMPSWWSMEYVFMHPDNIEKCREKGINNPLGMHIQDLGGQPEYGATAGVGKIDLPFDEYLQNVTFNEYFEIVKGEDRQQVGGQEMFCVCLPWGSNALHNLLSDCRYYENAIVTSEMVDALLTLFSGKSNQSLVRECWNELMLMEHHDTFTCISISMGEKLAKHSEFLHCKYENLLFNQSESFFVEENKELSFTVFNPFGKQKQTAVEFQIPQGFSDKKFSVYKDNVKLNNDSFNIKSENYYNHNIIKVVFEDKLQPLSFNVYRLVEDTQHNTYGRIKNIENYTILENDKVKIYVDLLHGGAISSYYDKINNIESVKHNAYFNEIKGYFIKQCRYCSNVENVAELKIINDGKYLSEIKVSTKIAGLGVEIYYSLYTDETLRIKTIIDYGTKECCEIGDPHIMEYNDGWRSFYDTKFSINAYFTTAFNQEIIKKDCAFDICASEINNTQFNDITNLKHNTVLRFIDASDGKNGLCVLSSCTTSYTKLQDDEIGLVLAVGMSSGYSIFNRSDLLEIQQYSYAICPHNSVEDYELKNISDNYNKKPVVYFGKPDFEGGIVIDLLSDSLELTAFFYENNGYYFRIYNSGNSQEISIKIGNMFYGILPCNIDKTICDSLIIAKDGICKDFLTKNQFKTYLLKVKQ